MLGKHGPRRRFSPKILNQACSSNRLQWPRVIRRQIDPLQFSQQCRDKPGGLTHCLIRHPFA